MIPAKVARTSSILRSKRQKNARYTQLTLESSVALTVVLVLITMLVILILMMMYDNGDANEYIYL